ncbi:MAG: hypothetical protein AAB518_02580 [Patescibacteria group bacterium]
MKKFLLRGIAEGLTGRSFVVALSLDEIFQQFPELRQAQNKLSITDNVISGFCACDG